MPKITRRQKAVLEAILAYTKENKYPPSMRELSDMIGLKSVSTIHGHLEKLKLNGLVSWEPGSSRTLRVLEEGERHAG